MATKKSEAKAPAKKRTVLSPAERIAKAEAALAALKAKAHESVTKQIVVIDEKLAKLKPKLADLQKQVDELEAQKGKLETEASTTPVTDGVGEPTEG